MINREIPAHYTDSPSSLSGTPQLTINRDITALELDSSHAFEGPEKLLEVWFAPSEQALPATGSLLGLKAVSFEAWKGMLDLVNCKVLSVIESPQMDAYLLSESSMFVFPHKLVLKTCGTTTLLCGLPRMLEIAALDAGFPHVQANLPQGSPAAATPYRVFYSRKNFLYPKQQRGPHRSWRDEVRYLDRMFLGGSAYMIGKMNGEHWYLYITGPDTELTPPATPESDCGPILAKQLIRADKSDGYATPDVDGGDETLEILMTDLDEENARQFYLEDASAMAYDDARRSYQARKHALGRLGSTSEHNARFDRASNGHDASAVDDDAGYDVFAQTSSDHSAPLSPPLPAELAAEGHALGTVVTEKCGLAAIYPTSHYPGARIDSYLFTPCGYSANGVVPAPGDGPGSHYWTVHVTPEPHGSYASFETNVPTRGTPRSTVDLVQQVVAIFQPGRFSVTLFEAKDAADDPGVAHGAAKKDQRIDAVKGYRRVDRIVHDLEGYELIFRHFERVGWVGGAPPRLGEQCV